MDETVLVYRMPEATLEHRLTGHKKGIYALDFSEDGNFLISGCMGGLISLWDMNNGQLVSQAKATGSVYDIKYDDVNEWLYVGIGRNKVWFPFIEHRSA